MLATLVGDDDSDPGRGRRASNSKNAPQFDVRTYLFRLCGVDLTRINGINPATALKVIAEVGPGCGLAMSHNRAGVNPALVTASPRPSI